MARITTLGKLPRDGAAAPAVGIETLLEQRRAQDLLRFVTCGSAGGGKSTLVGRLLSEARQLFDDQLELLRSESRACGSSGDGIDFALISDGLLAEREQGITIDVAYRFFATAKRRFIVADAPGSEQYTRNMVTGASTAAVAVLLVDARHGLLVQTRHHAFMAALLGIRYVVVAINKMDLVDFAPDVYRSIKDAFETFSKPLGFKAVTAIPLSALRGDNIVERSASTPWYKGPTLIGCLETVIVAQESSERLVFPVQSVYRQDDGFFGFRGSVAEGSVRVGDEIRVTVSGQTAVVSEIVTMDGGLDAAMASDAITLRVDREVEGARGDVISLSRFPLDTTDQFEATLIWLHEDAGLTGRNYDIKLSTQWASASITSIKYRIDCSTLAHEACAKLELNDISVCNVAVGKPLVFDSYENSPTLGSFILVDRFSHATVAAGMIRHSLRRAQNVHKQALSISRADRERLNGHSARVIWFTGLSGSGKSTLANDLEVKLNAMGMRTYILDGDNVRQGLNKDLGFTEADRVENIRRIAEVAKLMMDAGIIVMTAFISPFKREREMARELIGQDRFLEVFVSTPLDVCEQRDVKGLYKQARAGKIPNMTGINSPYEQPDRPAYVADSVVKSREAIVSDLVSLALEGWGEGAPVGIE